MLFRSAQGDLMREQGNPTPMTTMGSVLDSERKQAELEHALWESQLHAEQYLQYAESTRLRTRATAEAALNYQKTTFESAAQQYESMAQDICQAEVSQTRAQLEAEALTILNAQNVELGAARQAVGHLRQHLTDAQNAAFVEAEQQRSLQQRVSAELQTHKRAATVQQQRPAAGKIGRAHV